MELQFIGADRTVTGSMHKLKINNKTYLLDCGLYQGKRKDAFEINKNFDLFKPKEIDYLILSHAHIDQCGNIPNLVKKGFDGSIFCTNATKDLSRIMLKDSAHIQVKDVEYVNKKRIKQGKKPFEPLYDEKDAEAVFPLMKGFNYHEEILISDDVSVMFYDAGHILGSAIVYLKIKENGKEIKFGFSGDLGRPNLPILKDPEQIPDVDYFICESTYGGRFHDKIEGSEAKLAEVIKKAITNGGKIIVPAFSVGRTQELVYSVHRIFESKQAPRIPIYVDSPLSTNATEIFREHPECFDEDTVKFLNKYDDPFGFNQLRYITDVEDSKKLNDISGPIMIISASGMAETGRILHHLANNIENSKNIILMVGYCAENTLGKKLIDKATEVNIFGDKYKVNAEVIVMNSFSAHADSNELTDYSSKFDRNKLKNIFLVHGDYDQQLKYSDRLKTAGFKNISIPSRGDVFEI
ncbi:MAG: MBL fold metallo-hydrolase RNA specificity domain-containing protein [Ignavibacteriaceae bacterium]